MAAYSHALPLAMPRRYACLIGMQTALHSWPHDTWLGQDRYGYCPQLNETAVAVEATSANSAELEVASSNTPLPRCEQLGLFSWYEGRQTFSMPRCDTPSAAAKLTQALPQSEVAMGFSLHMRCCARSPAASPHRPSGLPTPRRPPCTRFDHWQRKLSSAWSCGAVPCPHRYVASLTWALMLITGTGGTDYYPSADSDGETMVVCAMVLCGALLWTYVLALFCDMATNSNPGLTQFKQLLDGLNHFIHAHRLPREMARRLREYLHQQKPGQLGKYAEKAIPVLSPALQVEVILHVHRQWLESTWFLCGLEPSCLVRLAREMTIQTLAPGEVAPMHNLCAVLPFGSAHAPPHAPPQPRGQTTAARIEALPLGILLLRIPPASALLVPYVAYRVVHALTAPRHGRLAGH